MVSLVGEFDMSNAHFLREQLGHVLDSSPAPDVVVLDLAGLDFADSTVLGVLIATDRSARAMDAALRLAGPPPFLRRMLAITSLHTVLDVFSDLTTAKTAAKTSPRGEG